MTFTRSRTGYIFAHNLLITESPVAGTCKRYIFFVGCLPGKNQSSTNAASCWNVFVASTHPHPCRRGEKGHCRVQCQGHFWSCHAFYLLTAGGVLRVYRKIQGLHILHQSIRQEMKTSVVLCKATLFSVSRTTSLLLTHQVPASHTHPGAEYPPF